MNTHIYHWTEFEDIEFQFDSDNDILVVSDVFHAPAVEKLLHKNGRPKYIFTLAAQKLLQEVGCPVYTIPFEFYKSMCVYFLDFKNSLDDSLPETTRCFNFTCNKKTAHRHLMIRLVEWFDFKNFNYTWSGAGRTFDMSHIIPQWDSVGVEDHDIRSFMLSPIELPEKFHRYTETELTHNDVCYYEFGEVAWSYQHAVKPVMDNTAVSLISESMASDLESASNFTEKTIVAMLSLTFPIFVGGYSHPDSLKEIGFDIFNDVIDHSYQYMPTLWQRCYWAIKLNHKILSDLDYAKTMREKHFKRLLNNRNLLFTNTIKNHIDSVISTWPDDLRDHAVHLIQCLTNK